MSGVKHIMKSYEVERSKGLAVMLPHSHVVKYTPHILKVAQPSLFHSLVPFYTCVTLHTSLHKHQVFRVTVHLPTEAIIEYRKYAPSASLVFFLSTKTTSYCFSFILKKLWIYVIRVYAKAYGC